jgi:MFS family permease
MAEVASGEMAEQAGIMTDLSRVRGRLLVLLLGNALMRIAGGASGVLVGLFLAELAKGGAPVNAAFVGTLGAVAFGAEVVGAMPMGLLSDALSARALMTGGAVAGAVAIQMFGLAGSTGVFLLSPGAEGLGAAAGVPPLLAHLTDTTEQDPALRARVMSYFELTLLAGFALGGVLASQLWRMAHRGAFTAIAAIYLLCSVMLYAGAAGSRSHSGREAWTGFLRAFRAPSVRRLAPAWVCVNAIVGLWLGPTITFLMTGQPRGGQIMAGIFAEQPDRMGWVLLGYALVFGTGVSLWSVVLPRIPLKRVLQISLVAMLCVCGGLLMLNHSGPWSAGLRWIVGIATAAFIMVESGFTPAALALLASVVGAQAGRGAAMGIYSMLLGIGAVGGSLLAAALGQWLAIDGLIFGTLAMALIALALLNRLHPQEALHGAR